MAEVMPNPESQQRPDVTDQDIERLMKAFEETDQEEDGKGAAQNEEIAELAASLDALGEQLQAEKVLEQDKVEAFKEALATFLDAAVTEEVDYVLGGRETVNGADMISVVIERSLEKGGVQQSAFEAFSADPVLRLGTKKRLMAEIEIKMMDREIGNDQEKISKLEKALDALENAS
ncbi:MAG: hypothetical protein QY323_05215 [Patescibacteria group bacterium]|nr:MAG: hypothetical protein QY323_05215 [Patescibacteria group bacterium]